MRLSLHFDKGTIVLNGVEDEQVPHLPGGPFGMNAQAATVLLRLTTVNL